VGNLDGINDGLLAQKKADRINSDELVTLNQLASHPGVSIFWQGVNISTTAHKFPFNVAVHYPKEHHGMPVEEGWFLLTTFPKCNCSQGEDASVTPLKKATEK
jgi:hypothetical protein